MKKEYPNLLYDTAETIIKISDYNRIAELYGLQQYELKDNEYIVLCDFESMKNIRDRALLKDDRITIAGKEYISKYKQCQSGFIMMSTSHTNVGIILVPDSCGLTEEMKERYCLIANYNADTKEEKERIEGCFTNYSAFGEGEESELISNIVEKGIQLDGMTKLSIIESSSGIGTVITFIAIYLGVIFLLTSSAILALKELTENSDNRQRYMILRKIGVDEDMLNQTLFKQIAIFFLMPLVLAVIHSVFGIQFALQLASVAVKPKTMLPSVVATVVCLIVIYGGYFWATYAGSKNIIKEV